MPAPTPAPIENLTRRTLRRLDDVRGAPTVATSMNLSSRPEPMSRAVSFTSPPPKLDRRASKERPAPVMSRGKSSDYAIDTGVMEERAREAMRQHKTFLFDADADGDHALTFEEFVAALPSHIRDERALTDIRSWFDLIDADANGVVTLNEYFRWSLSASSLITGSGVTNGFERYDHGNKGNLTREEFYQCAQDAGYGENAKEIWKSMPRNADGTLSYKMLIQSHASVKHGSAEQQDPSQLSTMKNFLTSMCWNNVQTNIFSQEELERSGWEFAADDAASMRTELTKLLRWHGVRLSELYEAMDTDGSASVSVDEFCHGLTSLLGFRGEPSLLHDVFTTVVDENGDGEVSFEELDAWVRGRAVVQKEHVRVAVRTQLALRPTRYDDPWDIGRLRMELKAALDAMSLTLDDLLETWDEEWQCDGVLTRREFIGHFKRLVRLGLGGAEGTNPLVRRQVQKHASTDANSLHGSSAASLDEIESLWYSKVRPAVTAVFDEYDSGRNHKLGVDSLLRALGVRKKVKLKTRRRSAEDPPAAARAPAPAAAAIGVLDMLCTAERREVLASYAEETAPASDPPLPRRVRTSVRFNGLAQPHRRNLYCPPRREVEVLLPHAPSPSASGAPSKALSPSSSVPALPVMPRKITSSSRLLVGVGPSRASAARHTSLPELRRLQRRATELARREALMPASISDPALVPYETRHLRIPSAARTRAQVERRAGSRSRVMQSVVEVYGG